MSTASSPPPAPSPGFFGKVPARGDFLSRRLPANLATAWEQWLQVLTATVREAAGADWPEAWLTAPLWHFALGEALAPPHGAAGVLVASADRVGRMFPFTVVGPCDPAAPADPAALAEWAQAVEAMVLDALEDGFDPATLDTALAGLGPPPPVTGPFQAPGARPLLGDTGEPPPDGAAIEAALVDDAVASILDEPPPPASMAAEAAASGQRDAALASILGDDVPPPPEHDAAAADGMAAAAAGRAVRVQAAAPMDQGGDQRPGPGQSTWWCRGSDRVAPVRLRCNGLPGPATAVAMVLGDGDAAPPPPPDVG